MHLSERFWGLDLPFWVQWLSYLGLVERFFTSLCGLLCRKLVTAGLETLWSLWNISDCYYGGKSAYRILFFSSLSLLFSVASSFKKKKKKDAFYCYYSQVQISSLILLTTHKQLLVLTMTTVHLFSSFSCSVSSELCGRHFIGDGALASLHLNPAYVLPPPHRHQYHLSLFCLPPSLILSCELVTHTNKTKNYFEILKSSAHCTAWIPTGSVQLCMWLVCVFCNSEPCVCWKSLSGMFQRKEYPERSLPLDSVALKCQPVSFLWDSLVDLRPQKERHSKDQYGHSSMPFSWVFMVKSKHLEG